MPSPCTPRRYTLPPEGKQSSKLLLLQQQQQHCQSTHPSPFTPRPTTSLTPTSPQPIPSPPSTTNRDYPLSTTTGPRAIPSASLFCSPPREGFRTTFTSHTQDPPVCRTPPITITSPSPKEWHCKSTGTRLSSPPRPSFVSPKSAKLASQKWTQETPETSQFGRRSPTQQLAPSSPLGRGTRDRAASISTPHSPLTPIPMKLNKRRNSYTFGGSLGTPLASVAGAAGSYLSPGSASTGGEKELFGSLVGSYEESILNGRMSTFPSKPIMFVAQIGVLGKEKCKPSLRCPPHINTVFPAYFYELQDDESPTPYVGTIDLDGYGYSKGYAYNGTGVEVTEGVEEGKANGKSNKKWHGYRVPPKGQLQVVVKNPNKTAVKLFLCPYDFSDMPAGTKTFLRQKSYIDPPLEEAMPSTVGSNKTASNPSSSRKSLQPSNSIPPSVSANGCSLSNALPPTPPRSTPTATPLSKRSAKQKASFRYGIHLQFTSPKEGRIYLSRAIRIVFSHRVPDGSEKLRVVTEGPGNPKYVSLSTVNSANGPGASLRGRRGSRVREVYFDEIEKGANADNAIGTLRGTEIDARNDKGEVADAQLGDIGRSRLDDNSDDSTGAGQNTA